MHRSQHGFTIIELVIVIAILGILGAVALPKFADLTGDAKRAAFDGIVGGFTSAVAVAHSKWLAEGGDTATATYSLEGGTTIQLNSNGWPTVSHADQDTVAEMWAKLMSGTIPAGWTDGATAAGSLTFDQPNTNATFTYNSGSGAVTSNWAP